MKSTKQRERIWATITGILITITLFSLAAATIDHTRLNLVIVLVLGALTISSLLRTIDLNVQASLEKHVEEREEILKKKLGRLKA
jgi:hypothetical protein